MGCQPLLQEDLSDPGIEPGSVALQADSLLLILVEAMSKYETNVPRVLPQGASKEHLAMARTLETFGPTLDLLRLRAPHWILEVMINILSSSYKGDFNLNMIPFNLGFPGGAGGQKPACQCRRHMRCGFDPWVKKIPWRSAWQPIPVFLPGESHGQRSLVDTIHRLQRVRHD